MSTFTGIPSIDRPTGGRAASRAAAAATGDRPVRLELRDDGAVDVLDENGDSLPPRLVRTFREQQGGRIDTWLQQRCEEINAELTAVSDIHLQCPSPDQEPKFPAAEFAEARPRQPVAKTPGFFERLFPQLRGRIDAENDATRTTWEQKMRQWRERKARFERAEQERLRLLREARFGTAAEMSDFFQHRVEALVWPCETLIDYQIERGGYEMFVDVELPEIKGLPRKQATVPSRGLRLGIRTISDARSHRNYARHIHGVLFRIIGEVFASFPRMRRVVGSGFSHRLDSATGTAADEYLISVSVDRRRWSRIDFSALDRVDPIEALARFDLRRRMTRTGKFTAIEPFTASSMS